MALLLPKDGLSHQLIVFGKKKFLSIVFLFLFILFFKRARDISKLDVGFGQSDLFDMWHYEISYVVINKKWYLYDYDIREDYALIRIKDEFQIPNDQIPTVNMLRVPHRSHLRVYSFDNHTSPEFTRQTVKLKMRNYECETDRDVGTFNAIDKLLCYQLRHFGKAYPPIDGAMIVKDKGLAAEGPPFEVFGMHVEYNFMNAWYMKVGRAINFAGRFNFWMQAAKFERLEKHIPADQVFFCCEEETIDTFEKNKIPYGQRNNATVDSDGDPPFC